MTTATKTKAVDKKIEDAPIANSAQELLSQAVAKGADIDTLERLMSLRKEMLAEEAKKAFNGAMSAFQAECPMIEKKKGVKTNTGQLAYKYAPIESIVSQVKHVIEKHGFRYSITMELCERTVKVLCRVVHELGHEEVSIMEVPLGSKTQIMSDSQVVAAASTFAKRYAFLNAFGIMTGDEDNDARLMPKQVPPTPQPQRMDTPQQAEQAVTPKQTSSVPVPREEGEPNMTAEQRKKIYACWGEYIKLAYTNASSEESKALRSEKLNKFYGVKSTANLGKKQAAHFIERIQKENDRLETTQETTPNVDIVDTAETAKEVFNQPTTA